MKEIHTRMPRSEEVAVPGSKSLTHRMLIAAGLSNGVSRIGNALFSDDTRLTMDTLSCLGVIIKEAGDGLEVCGLNGRPAAFSDSIHLGNSGTSMRLLAGVVALGRGTYRLTGSERMQERPIQDLLDSLVSIGIPAVSINGNGCPPIEISGGSFAGGPVSVDCTTSSQYLSALMLMAPCTDKGLEITVTGGLVSRPYIDLTVDVMARFGIDVHRDGYHRFSIKGGQTYRPGTHRVEADCSQAGYFWAAAAITGSRIKVKHIPADSRQGDIGIARVLEKMGCRMETAADGIAVAGGPLSAVRVDMSAMPDVVPTLAVVAAFAEGTTVIENVAHLREKESDRLAAVAAELLKMGVNAVVTEDGLRITGGAPRGAVIDTYDDHRIAMSFALAGLRVPGMVIRNEGCVAKSFPDFWDVFEAL